MWPVRRQHSLNAEPPAGAAAKTLAQPSQQKSRVFEKGRGFSLFVKIQTELAFGFLPSFQRF